MMNAVVFGIASMCLVLVSLVWLTLHMMFKPSKR